MEDDPQKGPLEPSTFTIELFAVLHSGWPNCVRMFLEFLPGIAMLSFLGSNTEHLAAAGMGFMFSNVSGFSVMIGLGSGAGPLISQAYGAGNFSRCGDLLQRQIAIHAIAMVFIGIIWLNTEHILVAFGQPRSVSRLSGQFVLQRVAALPFLGLRDAVGNFLVAQDLMCLPMIASIVAGIFNIVCFPILIKQMGFVGAPFAMTLANVFQSLWLGAFASRVLPHQEAWPQWSLRTAFSGWQELLRLALPSGLLMLCEWWGWEINLFFAGLLCDSTAQEDCIELDVFPIVANTMVIAFMCHIGFSIAAGARIADALGSGNPGKARSTSRVLLILVSAVSGTMACTLILLRWRWGRFFSDDNRVVQRTAEVLPLVATYIFCDALGPGALVSVLRSVGLVRLPAFLNILGFYVFGIPFGLYLTFGRKHENWGIMGLWSGLVLGMSFMVASLMIFLCCGVNWQDAAQVAQSQAWAKSERAPAQDEKMAKQVLGKQSYEALECEQELGTMSPSHVLN